MTSLICNYRAMIVGDNTGGQVVIFGDFGENQKKAVIGLFFYMRRDKVFPFWLLIQCLI